MVHRSEVYEGATILSERAADHRAREKLRCSLCAFYGRHARWIPHFRTIHGVQLANCAVVGCDDDVSGAQCRLVRRISVVHICGDAHEGRGHQHQQGTRFSSHHDGASFEQSRIPHAAGSNIALTAGAQMLCLCLSIILQNCASQRKMPAKWGVCWAPTTTVLASRDSCQISAPAASRIPQPRCHQFPSET